VIGDPTLSGATLLVRVRGAAAEQSFRLEAGGWTSRSGGYRYQGPAGGSAVRKAILLRNSAGSSLEVVLSGRRGRHLLRGLRRRGGRTDHECPVKVARTGVHVDVARRTDHEERHSRQFVGEEFEEQQ
jgi:hypothetical protein